METTELKSRTFEIERIIDNLPSAIFVLDRETRILLANRKAAVIAGKTRQGFSGLSLGDALNCIHAHDAAEGCGHGPECFRCLVRRAVEKAFLSLQKSGPIDAGVENETLGTRNLRLSTSYLSEEDVVILAIDDITEQKAIERESLEKNKILTAIETAGAVCHDMNQPLQVLLGYIDTLLESGTDEFTRECLGEMRKQTLRLRDITRNLQNLQNFKTRKYLNDTTILDVDCSTSTG